MPKDREGNFHPRNGAPSGRGVSMEIVVDHKNVEKQIEIEDKYGIDPDTNNVQSAQVRHPNRNSDKRSERGRTATKATTVRNQQTGSNGSNTIPETVAEITRDLLIELFEYKDAPCVSIYLSTQQMNVDMNEQPDAIAFKNALQQV